MTKTFKLLTLTIIVLVFVVITNPALAQDPEPNYDRINDIAEDLNCPTCTGINLADCRTLTCEQWRDKILCSDAERAALENAVAEALVARGARVVMVPHVYHLSPEHAARPGVEEELDGDRAAAGPRRTAVKSNLLTHHGIGRELGVELLHCGEMAAQSPLQVGRARLQSGQIGQRVEF